MAITKKIKPPLVQTFDRYIDREYYKHHGGLLFGYEKKVRCDRLEEELILKISSQDAPSKIFYNGLEVKLIPTKSFLGTLFGVNLYADTRDKVKIIRDYLYKKLSFKIKSEKEIKQEVEKVLKS
ncbi:MAG: hypothetical protein WC619_01940 [Patescibacteria group bacterium]